MMTTWGLPCPWAKGDAEIALVPERGVQQTAGCGHTVPVQHSIAFCEKFRERSFAAQLVTHLMASLSLDSMVPVSNSVSSSQLSTVSYRARHAAGSSPEKVYCKDVIHVFYWRKLKITWFLSMRLSVALLEAMTKNGNATRRGGILRRDEDRRHVTSGEFAGLLAEFRYSSEGIRAEEKN